MLCEAKAMRRKGKLSLAEAISMAVGTMIGASIFSIFGLGVQLAGTNLPEALALSGVYALMVAYSYATLGRKIVSNAGPIAFILRGIGDNVLTGALSILMWLTYVISISLFARGFAGYLLPLIQVEQTPLATGIVMVGIVLLFTALNFFGSKAVGRAEFTLVMIKLSVLLLFILGGFLTIKWQWLKPATDPTSLTGLLRASVIFFLSYMGFGLVTNASENIENPHRNVPLAIYLSIAIVIAIYVSVAMVALGNLPMDAILKAKENALAVAAKPFLGDWGFVLLSLGALISIASSLNATLYGGANVAYSLAKKGELPAVFERKVWFQSPEGLYLTAALSLFFALLFDLGGVASLTSIVFTVIYFFVIFSHWKLRKQYGGSSVLLLLHLGVLVAVLVTLLQYQWAMQRSAFYASIVTFAGALAVEYGYRRFSKRTIHKRMLPEEEPGTTAS